MKYLCDRGKVCRNSPKCGVKCILTEDKEHAMEVKLNSKIECTCLMDRNIIEDWLAETDLSYRLDGMNVILNPFP